MIKPHARTGKSARAKARTAEQAFWLNSLGKARTVELPSGQNSQRARMSSYQNSSHKILSHVSSHDSSYKNRSSVTMS